MLSAIAIIENGEILCIRKFRDDISDTLISNYIVDFVLSQEILEPAILIDETSFLHYIENDVYYVAITKQNANACAIFDFLANLPKIFCQVLDLKTFGPDEIKKFTPEIVELLDEMIDCGYIQNTDPETLRFLTQRLSKSTAITATEKHPTLLATSPIPWRATNIVYKTNELYVDVIEKVSLTISQEGETLNSEVSGTVTMKCFLSGMPEINVIFNDKIFPEPNDSSTNRFSDIDSVVFHQCVKLLNFSKDRSISFTPPDGEFELMRYRKTRNVGDPFKVLSSVRELPGNKLEVKISIRSMYDVKLNASPLSLTIPLPQNTAEVDVSSTHGKGKYSAEKNAVVWRVQQFPGKAQAEITVNVRYLSASSRAQEATQLREPISAAFNIPMFSASGVTLKNLKIYEKSGYTPEKYLRYTTQAGKYEIKMM